MKKLWYTIILSAVVLGMVLLGGCGDAANTADEANAANEVNEANKADEANDANESKVTAPEILIEKQVDEIMYENADEAAFSGGFDYVTVKGAGYEKLAASVTAWNSELAGTYEETMEMYREWIREEEAYAKEYEEEFGEPYTPNYASDYSITAKRADADLVSLELFIYEFGGGAHGNYGYRGATFDAQTGERLEIRDLFEDPEGFISWGAAASWEKIHEAYPEGIYEDGEEIVMAAWEEDPNWYLDETGILVVFDPYELGPYALGAVSVHFTYEECEGFGLRY